MPRIHLLSLILAATLLTCPGASCAAHALSRTGTLQGIVERGPDRAAGATLSIAGTGLWTRADSAGRFLLPGVPTGARTVVVWCFGSPVGRRPVLVHEGLSPDQVYLVPPGPDPRSADGRRLFEPDSTTGNVEGTITGAAGSPLPFPSVLLPRTHIGTRPDSEGHFLLPHLTPGAHALEVQARGSEDAIETVQVVAGRTTHVDFRLAARDSRLERFGARASNTWIDSTRLDLPVWPGTYLRACLGPDCAVRPDTVDAPFLPQIRRAHGRFGEYTLRIVPGLGGTLRVSYACGVSTRYRRVRIVDQDDIEATDFDNYDSFDRLDDVLTWTLQYRSSALAPPGRYRVRFETKDGADEVPFIVRWMRVRPDSIVNRGSIVGTVADSTGRPMRGVRLTIENHADYSTSSDSAGRFEFAAVPHGGCRVWTDRSYDEFRPGDTYVPPGGVAYVGMTQQKRAIPTVPGADIRGVVVDERGSPVGYANVIVLGTRRGAQADDHGRFVIPRVPVGTYVVKCQAAGRAPVSQSAIVVAGHDVWLRLVAGSEGTRPMLQVHGAP